MAKAKALGAKIQKAAHQREQGFGKPIISVEASGQRLLVVCNRIYHSPNWQTFHDFLREFLFSLLGPEWLREETAKSLEIQHPIARWVVMAQSDVTSVPIINGLRHGDMTGSMKAFMQLAYNLYLIAHNSPPDDAFDRVRGYVARLKQRHFGNFLGALYETYAAAAFLKAGFDIQYEEESKGKRSYTEFVAVYPQTGRTFSVEAKARNSSGAPQDDEVKRLRVTSKLITALNKYSEHERIVMIELNVPDEVSEDFANQWPAAAMDQIRSAEGLTNNDGQEFDPAYVIVTNHNYHSRLDARVQTQALGFGYKIPDFAPAVPISSFYEYVCSQERHVEIDALMSSLKDHSHIPATFDGQPPELAFDPDQRPRLTVGEVYEIPSADGDPVAGLLESGTVMESQQLAYCVHRLENGTRIIATHPLSDSEMIVWRRNPSIFFGEEDRVKKPAESPLDFAKFLYESYKNTDRTKLEEWLSPWVPAAALAEMDQKQLAARYCEDMAMQMWKTTQANKPGGKVCRNSAGD